MLLRALLGFILYGCCLSVFAHKASDSYLTIVVSADKVSGQWDIALRDLDFAIGLDTNDDSAITWKELRNKHETIATEEYRNCSNREQARQDSSLLKSDGSHFCFREKSWRA